MTTTNNGPAGQAHPLARFPGYDPAAPPLEITDLRVAFTGRAGRPGSGSVVVDGVSYRTAAGRTLAVVGESGCGKSLTARAVMGILPDGAKVTGGAIRLHGIDLLRLDQRALRQIRGRHIAMIFQDALSALNPVLPVGFQIAEVFRAHRGLTRREANRQAVDMLDRVRIPDAARRAGHYPHQFSGGMRQRVMIAMAIALTPEVVIADEPTTALDVTVQAQIVNLFTSLQRELGIAYVFIAHDLSVVEHIADRVAVMYLGKIVEQGTAEEVYDRPRHPYTDALLSAVPVPVPDPARRPGRVRLHGDVPSPLDPPSGCRFRTRCPQAAEKCATHEPPLRAPAAGTGHDAACHFPLQPADRHTAKA